MREFRSSPSDAAAGFGPYNPELDMLNVREVCKRTSLGRSTIYQMIADGTFPRPCRLSPRRVAWRSTDVNAWMQTRTPAAR
jgi:prophage regulatory protein